MPLDFIFVILLAWFAMKGYRKGIIRSLFSLVAVFVGMLGALKLSHSLSAYLFNSQSAVNPWIPMISYVIVFVAIVFLVNMLARTLEKGFSTVKLGFVNRLAGAFMYGLIVTFVWSSILWLANKVNLIKPETKTNSKTYAIIEHVAPKGFEIIGAALPIVKSAFENLDNLFDDINNHLPKNVDAHR